MALSPFSVRKLERADVEVAADLLARAFADNPTYRWMHPRTGDFASFFRRNLHWRVDLQLSWLVTEEERIVGTGSLEPPGGVPHRRRDLVSHWIWPTLRDQGPKTVTRIAQADGAFARHNRAAAGAPSYWHVHAVAVAPEMQGRGAGTALLSEVFRHLDAAVLLRPAPVVLSTQRERNLELYARFGFQVVAEHTLGTKREPFRSWWMLRSRATSYGAAPRVECSTNVAGQ